MKYKLFQITCLLLTIYSSAASQYQNVVKIAPGANVHRSFPKNKRFRFTSFQEGKIYEPNNKVWRVDLVNYDFLLNDMCFINSTHDTVSFKIATPFRYFVIGETIFVHLNRKGYYEVLQEKDSIKLCVQENFMVKSRERIYDSGYGVSSDPATSSFSRRNSNNNYRAILFKKRSAFFLLDKSDVPFKATKRNFLKLFTSKDSEISSYIKIMKTDFKLRESLESLFAYCAKLQ